MSARATNSNNYPSVSWADTLDVQWSALRWDVKRAMKSLCSKLEEIGEQCFVVTVNVSNGWVGHLGTVRGDEYIDEKSHILYDFLNYCAESLDYDNCEDGKTNNDLDTEISDVNVNEQKESEGEDDAPIRISRPGPATRETEGSDSEDRVIVQTPVKYQIQKPKTSLVPSELQLNNLILVNPIGVPLVTKNVAMATNIPVGQLSARNQTDTADISVKEDQATGGKRKRKQSFEGIVKYNRDRKLSDNTPKMSRSKIQTEPNSKHRVFKGQRKKNGNHSNQNDTEETESAESENNSDVSESDRVLRSKSLHGYRTRRKLLPRKRGEDGRNSDVDEGNDWDNDDDDYDDDNDDDEDWSEEMVARDKLGRFLPCESSSKKSKNKRKRQKASEFSVSCDNTDELEQNESIEESSVADGSEFDKEAGCVANVETNPNAGDANKKDPVKSDDEHVSQDTKGTNQNTEQEDDKTLKSRKRKGKMKLHEKQEKGKSCVESLSGSIDVQEEKSN